MQPQPEANAETVGSEQLTQSLGAISEIAATGNPCPGYWDRSHRRSLMTWRLHSKPPQEPTLFANGTSSLTTQQDHWGFTWGGPWPRS